MILNIWTWQTTKNMEDQRRINSLSTVDGIFFFIHRQRVYLQRSMNSVDWYKHALAWRLYVNESQYLNLTNLTKNMENFKHVLNNKIFIFKLHEYFI